MALTYIKESHDIHGTLDEGLYCPTCFAELPEDCRTAHGRDRQGYRRVVRVAQWVDDNQECRYCSTRHDGQIGGPGLAPELRRTVDFHE